LALGTALLATLLLAVLAVAVQPFGAPAVTRAANVPDAAEAGGEQCYAWEIFNATGADADELSIRLTGVQNVTSVYTGDANPFGEPRAGSGYDAGSNSFLLDFGVNAVTVAAGEVVKAGMCTPDTVQAAQIQWLAGTTPLGASSNLPALTWNWPSAGTLQVQLTNTTGVSVTVLGLRLLSPEEQLGIDDLDAAVAANQDPAGAELEEPTLLAPGAVFTLDLPLAAEGPGRGEPVLLAVEWAEGEDLSATTSAYIATTVRTPEQLFLPAVRR
jgi:hypothetical protein